MGVVAPTGHRASGRMLASLHFLALFAFANLIGLQPAAARSKFIDTAEQIARADLIVVGRVISVAQGKPARFKLKIERSLLGKARGIVELDGGYWQIDWPAKTRYESTLAQPAYARKQFSRIEVIGGTSNLLTCGARRIFYLARMPALRGRSGVISLIHVGDAARAEIARVNSAIRLVPKWRDTASGLSVILLPKIDAWPATDMLALQFGIRNVSDHAIQLNYGGNTRAQRSFVALDIVDRRGKRIDALENPFLDAKAMREFFVSFGARKPILLEPGQSFFVRLDGINQASEGMGYKDELGFQYYPMPSGRYNVVAHGVNYFPGLLLSSLALTVEVK